MVIVKLDMIQTLGLALGCLLIGYNLQKRVDWLKQWLIPAPLLGGVLYAIFSWVLRAAGIADIQLDTALQPYLFAGFFASIGLRAGRKMLAEGAPKVAVFMVITTALALVQKLAALGVGGLFGLSRPAITASSAVLMGGSALANNAVPVLTGQGLSNAQAIVAASATFGLLLGSFLGGPLLVALMGKQKLTPAAVKPVPAPLTPPNLIGHVFLFALCIGLGKWVSVWTGGVWIPAFAGAMLVGVALRNIEDVKPLFHMELPYINVLGNFALSCTLTMAFMGLKLHALAAISLPLLAVLLVQLLLPLAVGWWVVYPLLGRNWIAAMVAAGLPGFSVGVPANTMATLQCAQENHGALPMATLVVPTVGAWLITLVHPYIINLFM